jgi:hypothetical protein
MVHALAESWRVLQVGGRLIDLRPYSSGWPVEIVSRDRQMLAGLLDDTIGLGVDTASDNAVLEAVQRGWFEKENEGSFEFTYYWDSVDEMDEFVKAKWCDSATVPDSILSETRRLVQLTGEQVQVRIRRTMLIASYRKLAECERPEYPRALLHAD